MLLCDPKSSVKMVLKHKIIAIDCFRSFRIVDLHNVLFRSDERNIPNSILLAAKLTHCFQVAAQSQDRQTNPVVSCQVAEAGKHRQSHCLRTYGATASEVGVVTLDSLVG